MARATLTSKGQLTIPKDVRDRLSLRTGDRLEVLVEGDRAVLVRVSYGVAELASMLPAPVKRVPIVEMDRAVRARAATRKR